MNLPAARSKAPGPLPLATIIGLVVGLLSALWFLAARHSPDAVESLYAQRFYPHLARFLAWLSSSVPFSLGEALLVAIGVALLLAPWSGYRRARRGGWGREWSVAAALLRLLARAGTLWFLFLLCWGLNYLRPHPEQRLELTPPRESEETRQLIEQIGKRLDGERGPLPQDENGVVSSALTLDALDAELRVRQAEVMNELKLPAIEAGRAKKFELSPLLLRWGVAGMYAPFTAEPQVVLPAAPGMLPFTLAHERAHLSGFAWEEEASFIGLLTCWRSPLGEVRYAAWMELWIALGGGIDKREPGVQRDMRAISQFVTAHRGKEAPLVWKAYSGYLKAHGVQGGTKSYGRVAGLALAWLEKHGLPAAP